MPSALTKDGDSGESGDSTKEGIIMILTSVVGRPPRFGGLTS